MSPKRLPDLGKLKQSIEDISEVFGIESETLFAIMIGCAARGKADWTREGVIQVIRMIKNGKDAGEIISGFMPAETPRYLH